MNKFFKKKPICRDDATIVMLEPEMALTQCDPSSEDEYVEAVEEVVVEVPKKKKNQKKNKAKSDNVDVIEQIAAKVVVDATPEKDDETASEPHPVAVVKAENKLVMSESPASPELLIKKSDSLPEKENLPPIVVEKTAGKKKKEKNADKGSKVADVETLKDAKTKQLSNLKLEEIADDVIQLIREGQVEPVADWAEIAGDIADTPYEAEYEKAPQQPEKTRPRSRNNSYAPSNRNRSRNHSNHRSGHQTYINSSKVQKTRSGHSIAPPPKSNSNDVRLDRKFNHFTGANAIPLAQTVYTHSNPPIIKQKSNSTLYLASQPQQHSKQASTAPQGRQPSPAKKERTNIFGNAKPVDTAKKLKEIEAKRFAESGTNEPSLSGTSSPTSSSRQTLNNQFKSMSMIIYRTGLDPDQCNPDVPVAFLENLSHNQSTDVVSHGRLSLASSSRPSSQASNYQNFAPNVSAVAVVGNNAHSKPPLTITAPIPNAGNEGNGSSREPIHLSPTTPLTVTVPNGGAMHEVVKPSTTAVTSTPVFEKPHHHGSMQRQRRSTIATNSPPEFNHRMPPPPPPHGTFFGPMMNMPPPLPHGVPCDGSQPPQFVFMGAPQQHAIRFPGPPQMINPNVPGPRQPLMTCRPMFLPPNGPPPHPPQNQEIPAGIPPHGNFPQGNNVSFVVPPNANNVQPPYVQGPDAPAAHVPHYVSCPPGGPPQVMAYPPQAGHPQVRPIFVDYQNGAYQPNHHPPVVYMLQPNGLRVQLPVNYTILGQPAGPSQSFGSQKSGSSQCSGPLPPPPPPGMLFPPNNYQPMNFPQHPMQHPVPMNPETVYFVAPAGPPQFVPPPPVVAQPPPPPVPPVVPAVEPEMPTEDVKEKLLHAETKFNPYVAPFIPMSQRTINEVPSSVSMSGGAGSINGNDNETNDLPEDDDTENCDDDDSVQQQSYTQPPPSQLQQQYRQQLPPPPPPYQQSLPPYHQNNCFVPSQYNPHQNNGYMPSLQQPPPPLPPNAQCPYSRPMAPWQGRAPYGAPVFQGDMQRNFYPRTFYGANQMQNSPRPNFHAFRNKRYSRDGQKQSTTDASLTIMSPVDVSSDAEQNQPKNGVEYGFNDTVASKLAPDDIAQIQQHQLIPNNQSNDSSAGDATSSEYTVEFTAALPESDDVRETTPEVSVTLPLNARFKKQRRSFNRRAVH